MKFAFLIQDPLCCFNFLFNVYFQIKETKEVCILKCYNQKRMVIPSIQLSLESQIKFVLEFKIKCMLYVIFSMELLFFFFLKWLSPRKCVLIWSWIVDITEVHHFQEHAVTELAHIIKVSYGHVIYLTFGCKWNTYLLFPETWLSSFLFVMFLGWLHGGQLLWETGDL